jgi:hypothetical protein
VTFATTKIVVAAIMMMILNDGPSAAAVIMIARQWAEQAQDAMMILSMSRPGPRPWQNNIEGIYCSFTRPRRLVGARRCSSAGQKPLHLVVDSQAELASERSAAAVIGLPVSKLSS